MPSRARNSYYDGQRRRVELGGLLGEGGEGGVYEVRSQPSLVAKVYHQAPGPERSAKIAAMARLRTDRLLRLAAWPVDTLHESPGGPLAGLLMPKVTGHQPVHRLYAVKTRLVEFPDARWPFLVHAAGNLARAFAVIHEHGHVIGDVNHGNALVSDQGLIRLIDCDSFQVRDGSYLYRCEVGVSTHQPPELQGSSFRGLTRTQNHDNFGLAVLIFQLLFMARHPFSGRYLGQGDMPIERAIREFRFAYGQLAPRWQMQPPPAALTLEAVSYPVAQLFERAFSPDGPRDGGRPSPQEWISALGALSRQLKTCSRNQAHQFFSALRVCPWCEIEARSGVVFFRAVVVGVATPSGSFNLAAIWAQISAVTSPGAAPDLPTPSAGQVQPSPWAVRAGVRRRRRVSIGIATVALAIIAINVIPITGGAAFWSLVVAVVSAYVIGNSKSTEIKAEADRRLRAARSACDAAESRWREQASDQRFRAMLLDLDKARRAHLDLPNERQRRLHQLEANKRERQLHKFLDRHRIQGADIPNIGPGRKATLQSYGIETAADVSAMAIAAIPGFGPALTSNLVSWRRQVESRFTFNPARGIDPADIAAVDRDITATRTRLERELAAGPVQLRQIAQQIQHSRQTLATHVAAARIELTRAQVDAAALSLKRWSMREVLPLPCLVGLPCLAWLIWTNSAVLGRSVPPATPSPPVAGSLQPTPSPVRTATRVAVAAKSQAPASPTRQVVIPTVVPTASGPTVDRRLAGQVRYIANTAQRGVRRRSQCIDETGVEGPAEGAVVTIDSARSDCPGWYWVRLGSGEFSWVREAYLSASPPASATVTPAPRPR